MARFRWASALSQLALRSPSPAPKSLARKRLNEERCITSVWNFPKIRCPPGWSGSRARSSLTPSQVSRAASIVSLGGTWRDRRPMAARSQYLAVVSVGSSATALLPYSSPTRYHCFSSSHLSCCAPMTMASLQALQSTRGSKAVSSRRARKWLSASSG